jgi:hypothetical protein
MVTEVIVATSEHTLCGTGQLQVAKDSFNPVKRSTKSVRRVILRRIARSVS